MLIGSSWGLSGDLLSLSSLFTVVILLRLSSSLPLTLHFSFHPPPKLQSTHEAHLLGGSSGLSGMRGACRDYLLVNQQSLILSHGIGPVLE